MTKYQIMERMGAEATEADAIKAMELLSGREPSELTEAEWLALITQAVTE